MIDQAIASLKSRFNQNTALFSALNWFAPRKFVSIRDNDVGLENSIQVFCRNYDIDSQSCAAELRSMAFMYKRLNREDKGSFMDVLNLMSDENFYLVDAYPLLFRAYTIAMAIPISSCTAERSFSVLKRIKTPLRCTMLQEKLEAFLLMAIEKEKLEKVEKRR